MTENVKHVLVHIIPRITVQAFMPRTKRPCNTTLEGCLGRGIQDIVALDFEIRRRTPRHPPHPSKANSVLEPGPLPALRTEQMPKDSAMLTQQELVDRMREWAVRVTPQRLAIAEVVLNSQDHPTVQQIYERVRGHFPSMTLATIYSTLGVLQKSGLIQGTPLSADVALRTQHGAARQLGSASSART